jgi:hypothetical protein
MPRAELEAHVARCSGEADFDGAIAAPYQAHHQQRRGHHGGAAAAPHRATPSAPAAASPPPDVNANYTVEGGGCFGAATTLEVLRPGSTASCSVAMRDIAAGDAVRVEGGGTATVTCVVRYSMPPGTGVVSVPGGPVLTAHHPLRVAGQWRAPVGLGPIVPAGTCVYNLVLDRAPHVVLADGWPCVTLGHGLTDPGAVHAFYGTQACIEALRPLPGFARGLVEVAGTVRGPDGRSIGFVPLLAQRRREEGGEGGAEATSILGSSSGPRAVAVH